MLRPLLRPVPLVATAAVSAIAVVVLAATSPAGAAPPTDPADTSADTGAPELTEILTPEQITCIAGEFTPEIADDPAAAVQVLTDCDVSLDQLADLMPASGALVDPEAVATVLALAGLDTEVITCLGAGLGAAPLADDGAALELLQGCGLGLAELLHGLVGIAPAASGPVGTAP